MKYMHFPRSCAYTAVANLLEAYGVDTSDQQMALEIRLPYQFRKDGDTYLAGTMLQTAQWFDRYLNPRGFRLVEETVSRNSLISFLTQRQKPCMLGVRLDTGRHAINFHHAENGALIFSNNRHPETPEPDSFSFPPEELLQRVEENVVIGALERLSPCRPDTSGDLSKTLTAFASYREALAGLWTVSLPQHEILAQLDPLFAPLFLDAPIMMRLIGQDALSQSMISMRAKFISALRQAETLKLCDVIPVEALLRLLDNYLTVLSS